MNKKIIIGLSLLSIGILQAQKSEQYLHFNIGGGSNSLNYQIKDGTQKGAAGFTINAAYSYFFNQHWGLQSGLGVQSFGSQSTLNLLTTELAVDNDGESYELSTKYNNLKENQRVLSIEIPVLGQYKYAFNSQWGLIASAGAKISIPAYRNFKTAGGDITTTGYYSQWNLVLYDLPQHGFFTTNDTYQGKLAVKPAYIAVAELGGLYKISKKMDLYLGGYFNYGLNNILTPDSKHIFLQDRTYNGILASNQTAKVIPVSVGVKVGIYWQQGEKKSADVSKTISEPELKAKEPAVAKVNPVISESQTVSAEPVTTQEAISVPVVAKEEVAKPVEKEVAAEPVAVVEQPKAETPVLPEATTDPLIKAKELAVSITKNMLRSSTESIENDRVKITGEVDVQMKELSNLLIANPDFRLYVVGYTDNSEVPANSLKTGLKKALAARQAFVKNSVPGAQLIAKTKGQYAPLFPNNTTENKKKNNRIELKVGRISNVSK